MSKTLEVDPYPCLELAFTRKEEDPFLSTLVFLSFRSPVLFH